MQITLHPNDQQENEDLLVWLTFPGEEYFLHMSLWRETPFRFKLEKQTESADLAIRTVVQKEFDGCDMDSEYDYMGVYCYTFSNE